jgi:hypothetical protein
MLAKRATKSACHSIVIPLLKDVRRIVARAPWNHQTAIIWPPQYLGNLKHRCARDPRIAIKNVSSLEQRVSNVAVCDACVCLSRNAWLDVRGCQMKGGLRWPFRPFQVVCVLVAVLLTAAFSSQRGLTDRVGASTNNCPTNNWRCTSFGERSNASTITVVPGNPNLTYLKILKIADNLPVVRDDGDDVRAPRQSASLSVKPFATSAAADIDLGTGNVLSGGRASA